MNGSRFSYTIPSLENSRRARFRRGSVMGLMAVVLPVLAILAAFCINCAQMQLTRTELMVATDAAARAGGRAFSEMQTVSAAKTAAVVTAALNNVDGEPLRLQRDDSANEIEFGITSQPNGDKGRYVFEKVPTSKILSGQGVASAIRIRGRRESGSLSGRVPLVIPGLLNANDFSTVQSAVAMQVDRDISLVLDRSGSMGWIDWNWPPDKKPFKRSTKNAAVDAGLMKKRNNGNYTYINGTDDESYKKWAWEEHYGLGPAPKTPWEDLVTAVDAFLDVLDVSSQKEQVSVASYSSSATLDSWLELDYDIIRDTVDQLEVEGNTAIGKGMREGILALLDHAARANAAKTMVVMTDGIHNTGISPDKVASELMSSSNLTIHTVTFGTGADQELMQDVAYIGGGKHFHAATGAELIAVFEEIANNLPTMLTK